jgi:hypothetical protein
MDDPKNSTTLEMTEAKPRTISQSGHTEGLPRTSSIDAYVVVAIIPIIN